MLQLNLETVPKTIQLQINNVSLNKNLDIFNYLYSKEDDDKNNNKDNIETALYKRKIKIKANIDRDIYNIRLDTLTPKGKKVKVSLYLKLDYIPNNTNSYKTQFKNRQVVSILRR